MLNIKGSAKTEWELFRTFEKFWFFQFNFLNLMFCVKHQIMCKYFIIIISDFTQRISELHLTFFNTWICTHSSMILCISIIFSYLMLFKAFFEIHFNNPLFQLCTEAHMQTVQLLRSFFDAHTTKDHVLCSYYKALKAVWGSYIWLPGFKNWKNNFSWQWSTAFQAIARSRKSLFMVVKHGL